MAESIREFRFTQRSSHFTPILQLCFYFCVVIATPSGWSPTLKDTPPTDFRTPVSLLMVYPVTVSVPPFGQ